MRYLHNLYLLHRKECNQFLLHINELKVGGDFIQNFKGNKIKLYNQTLIREVGNETL